MKRDLRNKWVAALRGGGYAQGQFRLRTRTDTFCCLGVLCDIAGLPGARWVDRRPHPVFQCPMDGGCWQSGIVPPCTLLGLEDLDMEKLMLLNDQREPPSFAEIADWIETNVAVED